MSIRRVVLCAGVWLTHAAVASAQQPREGPTRARTLAEDLQLFSQVLNQIRVNHPDSMDSHAMMMAAIEGLVGAVDPHSYVIPAVRLDSARQRALEDGKLATVPISFAYVGGVPLVVSIAPATQASREDIVAGDELLSIAGETVSAASAAELELSLAGAKGSSVALRFRRRRLDGTTTQLDRTVLRESGDEATAVPAAFMLDTMTGYVRITTFANAKVADDLHDAIGRLERSGMKRLLLDLRDNGGGLVAQAGDVAGEFLPKGAVMYTTEGRKASVRKTVKVARSFWRGERSYPVVVLTNAGTASASELVAGALQDHDRAVIVGRPSFGKALLMQGMPLTDGSVMMLVVGHIKTPCGRVIQRQYRQMNTTMYYRAAGALADTTGRPSCRSASGRTLYGGGGIYPDVVLDESPPTPLWLTRVRESGVALKWAGARMSESLPASVDSFLTTQVVTPSNVQDFRAAAAAAGVQIPAGDATDAQLQRELRTVVARLKLGDAAFFRLIVVDDPWIPAAIQAFSAASILKGPSSAP
ncbi:MAG TPA: S41 family peptidase [Gemmatimonadaceae bacterium]|nr:S41 family peptidase [Gemmatimonadaceae bacterium]